MVYPKNFEEKIDFEKIRAMLKDFCLSTMGRAYVDKMSFSGNYKKVKQWLFQTEEFRQLLMLGEPFPTQDYHDLTPILERLKIENTFIEIEPLVKLKNSLQTIHECIAFFNNKDKEQYPELKSIIDKIILDKSILHHIDNIMDERGEIKDTASKELGSIRKKQIQKNQYVNGRIEAILKHAKSQGWAPSGSELTVRGGRAVIPLHATDKRKIKGLIHDESATGQTVFIEPAEIFDVNNEIRELENAEKREMIKILTRFSNEFRPHIEDLKNCYYYLGIIDFIRAKGRLALEMDAYKPDIQDKQLLEWTHAKHPLLYLAFKNNKKEVVSFNLELNPSQRILVISGPNAGGKSVCLKTVGLIQYMIQCGLAVPMKEYSVAGIFKNILIDIGDEQSLENDLSTYSSHLVNMKNFINLANKESLFLIDELGTGTEPQLGGAIAEAVLTRINQDKALGVVTTHYANIKVFAGKNEGVVNGAMLYDSKNMKPLYQLRIGKPGSSFAFEIAKNIGLQKAIINNAMNIAGRKQINYDSQLQDLEVEKSELEKKKTEFQFADELLAETIEKYQALYEDVERSRKDILNQAMREAKNILDGSNKVIEKTIREIRETQAEKEATKKAREKVKKEKELLEKNLQKQREKKARKIDKEIITKEDRLVSQEISAGDHVKIKGQNEVGEVISVGEKDAMVLFGSVKMKVRKKNLEKTLHKAKKTLSSHRMNFDINEKARNFDTKLDVRGQKAEEAILNLQNFIDDAVLLGIREVKILHGKGDGILRHVIRQQLHKTKEVSSVRDEHIEMGGQGITVVELR